MTFDAAELLERLSGDEELFADVIAVFLEDCPERVAAIEAAAAGGDVVALRAAAHALKGAAGNLSAHELFAAAEELEAVAQIAVEQTPRSVARVRDAAAALLSMLPGVTSSAGPSPTRLSQ